MAFFPIYHYRIYDDPVQRYLGDQLDCFDPWHDQQTPPTTVLVVPNAFRWVNEPQQAQNTANKTKPSDQQRPHNKRPPNAQKYRVQLNVAGFNPETIKTKIEGQKIIVEASQEERQPDGDFHIRQLRKSFPLPEHADAEHLASYITPNKILVVEVPIRDPEIERRSAEMNKENQNVAQFGQHRDARFDYHEFLTGSDFQPKIVDKGDNKKQLEMSIEMKEYRPDEIKVSVKNNELIVRGERRHKDGNHFERSFFFKSTTLPPGTQVEQLQSHLSEDGHLKIEAPFIEQKQETDAVEDKKH